MIALLFTHWGRVMHICISKLTTIGSDNGLSPGWRQAIIWTNAGILLIAPLGINFSEILININTFSFNKMHLKMSSAKWCLFHLGLNELIKWQWSQLYTCYSSTAASAWAKYWHDLLINSLRPRQNRRHFADDILKCNFLNENVWIPIQNSLKFVPKGPFNNIPALVQLMAWRRTGDKPLSEPMMTKFNDAYMCHSASMS